MKKIIPILLLSFISLALSAQLKFEKDFTGYQLINKKGEVKVKYISEYGSWKNGRCKLVIKPFATNDTEYAYVNDQGDIIGVRSSIDFDLDKAPCLVQKKDEKNSWNTLSALTDKNGKLLTDWHGLLEAADNGYYWFGTDDKFNKVKVYKGLLNAEKKIFEADALFFEKDFINADIACLSTYKNYYCFHIPSGNILRTENYMLPTAEGFIVQISGLYGKVDKNLNITVKPQFENLLLLQHNPVRYKVSKDAKWGIVDEQFKEIIPLEYPELVNVNNRYLFKKDENNWGILNEDGKLLHSATADKIRIDSSSNCIISTVGNYSGAVGIDGKTIVPYKYEKVFTYLGVYVGQKRRIFDIYGKSGTLIYKTEDKSKSQNPNFNIVGRRGSLIWVATVPPKKGMPTQELWIDVINEKPYFVNSDEFDKVNRFSDMIYFQSAGPLMVSLGYKEGDKLKYQYYDIAKGKKIGPEFDGISNTETVTYWSRNAYKKNKVNLGQVIAVVPAVVVGISNVYNRVTAGSTQYTEEKTSWIFWGSPFSEGLALVSRNNLFGYMDEKGGLAIPAKYFNAASFSEGLAAVVPDSSTALWGLIDKTGREVIAPKYQAIGSFSDGLCPVQLNDKAFFIDKKGNTYFESYNFQALQSFSEGVAAAKQNGKWGYIDLNGKWIVNPQFDGAEAFENGIGKIFIYNPTKYDKEGQKRGYVNKKGEIVITHN